MRAILGLEANQNGKPIIWSPEHLVNPHVLITGKSGTGKTHLLRSLIRQCLTSSSRPVRIHVLDVHDDIVIAGASEQLFSQNCPYGLNPLHIDPDPHFGGVRRAIENFLRLMNQTSAYKMGDRQMAVIRNLLSDLYRANGFYEDQPKSWHLQDGINRQYPKKYPTVEDFYKFSKHKQKSMTYGRSKSVDTFCRALKKLNGQALEYKYGAEDKKETIDLYELKDKAVLDFRKMLDSLETGNELDDHHRYGNTSVMSSVIDRFSALTASGVFTGDSPPFDVNIPVWRYRIKPLTHSDSLMFVHTLLWRLYYQGIKQGEQDHVTDVIVLDETKRYQDDNPDNPVNLISTEGRKFGLCLIGAGQSHSHFSEDFASTVGTNIVLQQDDMFFDKLKRTYKLEQETLSWLRPRSRALVKLQTTDETEQARYKKVSVNDEDIKRFLSQRAGRPVQNANPAILQKIQPVTQSAPVTHASAHASAENSRANNKQKPASSLAEYLIEKADL